MKNPMKRVALFDGKKRLFAALVGLLAAGFGRGSDEFKHIRKVGCSRGRHGNCASPGAFGGPKRAKSHRMLYIASLKGRGK